MSLQEISCFKSALFYNGGFKMMQEASIIRAFIDRLSQYFIDPLDNWDTINNIFSLFGNTKTISSGSPSKSEDLGDGTKTPYTSASKNVGCVISIFNTCEGLGLLINPDDLRVTYNARPDTIEREHFELWKSILASHDVIKEAETSMILIASTLSSMYNSDATISYSPAQIAMFDNVLVGTSIIEPQPFGTTDTNKLLNIYYSSLIKVPWNTIDHILKPVVTALFSPWRSSLVQIDTVNVEYDVITVPPYTVNEDNLYAGDITAGRVPINFAGNNKVLCLEKALIVTPNMIPNPDYIDPPDPLVIPPIPEEILGPIPSCFGNYGTRITDPNPTVYYDPETTDSSKFVCGRKKFPVEDLVPPEWTPPGYVLPNPPPDPLIYPITSGDILVDGCPYIEQCKAPHHVSPVALDYRTGVLNVGSAIDATGINPKYITSERIDLIVDDANNDETRIQNPEHYHCINGKSHPGDGPIPGYIGGPDVSYSSGTPNTPIKIGDVVFITYRAVRIV